MSLTVPAIEAELAYRACERITRSEAANFYYGIRLLPRAKREAMSAVYAFARRVDDIGDAGLLSQNEQLRRLAGERALLARIAREGAVQDEDPVAVALAHAWRRYELPLDALELLVDGVELDVRAARFQTFDEVAGYCRAVAGSIGRLCLTIFCGGRWNEPAQAAELADALGVAMQLTNILRDVREDHERGRCYMPGEDLERFGCQNFPDCASGSAAQLIAFEAERAEAWFHRGSACWSSSTPAARRVCWP